MACPFDGILSPGIVPVFVNAGAALLPAIVAGLASAASLLLKPRELLRACRRKPHVPLLIAACAAGVYFGGAWLLGAGDKAAQGRRAGGQAAAQARTDWAKVAIEIIQKKERARNLAPSGSQPSSAISADPPSTAPAASQASADANAPAAASRAAIYRGDASRCGYGGGKPPLNLAALWDFTTENTMFLSSPVVVADAVYSASCMLDLPGNYGAIFCLDAATGEKRWLTETFPDPRTGKEREFKGFFSSPAVSADGKSLVIGQGLHVDADCEMLCFDTGTGRLRWAVRTPLHIEGSPAIEGDIAVAGAGAIEGDDHKAKGNPGFVLAVRVSDGRKLWEYQVNDPESSPAIDGGVVYIGSGFNGNAVVALRAETDEELKGKGLDRLKWKTPTPHPATGTITLTEELVLIGCGNADYVFSAKDPDGAVLALDRRTGAVRWQVKMPDAVLGAIAVRNGRAICPVRNGEVVALDLGKADGDRVLWRQRVNGKSPVLAGCAVTDAYVYAVSQDGYLAVLDARDGKVVERHYINAKGKPGEMGLSVSSPFVVNGRLYVGSETGGLRCFTGLPNRVVAKESN